MRLTKRNGSPTKGHAIYEQQYKLRTLEDIEDELGIDLLTLFKVLKYGIFDKQGKYYCPHLEYIDDEHRKEWILIEEQGDYRPDIWFHFKDYGKTWALTKEELQ